MDIDLRELLEAAGYAPIDIEAQRRHQQYNQYLNDPLSVPPDVRQIFDHIAQSHRIWKPKDDEAFRFFSDESDINT